MRDTILNASPGLICTSNALMQDIEVAVASAAPKGTSAVFLLDIDKFQRVNRTFGHDRGDELLVDVCSRITETLNFIAEKYALGHKAIEKLGSDQFVILITEAKQPDIIFDIGRELLSCFDRSFKIKNEPVHLTASMGYSTYPCQNNKPSELLQFADSALAHAKLQVNESLVKYTPDMKEAAEQAIRLEHDIEVALNERQFFLVYQPQVCLESGIIVSFEALIRWNHPTRGVVSPIAFISEAESSGQILQIGEWVLQEACAQASSWIKRGFAPTKIGVNLSPVQFARGDIVGQVVDSLMRAGLSAEYLEVEITESTIMADLEKTIAILHELRDIGVSIAIDDFGTGHSSLGYLTKFPVDTLKIDQSFIAGLTSRNPDEKIVTQAVIDLGSKLNMRIVAEGVEREDQLGLLKEGGCHMAQGYLIGKPQIAQRLDKMRKATKDKPYDTPAISQGG
ncbi:hypothetical protein A3709_20160 [Halioglobus sp. HI00S01]|uniref:putative bifunctional diguanylate cyclase/phosphodiesterase n=1 Tax=Halioglobus sp. HI00S01 TaxID=1822214 RepID=UPI0007C22F2D|nr:bifunctional diguanylate cyclase/phosphodiesterase [Halioglobus sp. HI00S01]KZX57941.1 hypothetical protein A3709_20160 [Halioglobus sp. HI00S01]